MDRDTDALKKVLERHSVQGYEVVVPVFSEARIIRQQATGPVRHITPDAMRLGSPMVYYEVEAKTPVPFNVWVDRVYQRSRFSGRGGSSTALYNLEQIPQDLLNITITSLRNRLERGGSISYADIEKARLIDMGCMDPEDMLVTCYSFFSSEVQIDPRQLKRGLLVEYEYQLKDKDEKQFLQGRIVGFMDKQQTALVELFTPLPYLETPDSIDNSQIKKGFYSEGTFTIGYGAHEAFEIAEEETGRKLIPEGKWDQEHRTYTLKELFPLSAVKELCDMARDICAERGLCDPEEWDREPFCLRHSLIMYIVPIKLYDREYKGVWRPLPEHAIESEYVVSYDFEEE